jgi:hypothetical protein
VDENSIIRNSRALDCEILAPGQTRERGWILSSAHFVAIPSAVGHGVVARYLAAEGAPTPPVPEAIKALLELGVVRKASWSHYELDSSAIHLVEDDLVTSGKFGEAVFLDVWVEGCRKHFAVEKGWESLGGIIHE